MKNQLITTIKFNEPRKAEVIINEENLIISNVKFDDKHDQDCCEKVYADFKQAKYYKKQIEEMKEITKLEVKSVKVTGFIIFIYNGTERLGVLINCYNEQNGYYSDELKLNITDGEQKLGEFEIEKYSNIY